MVEAPHSYKEEEKKQEGEPASAKEDEEKKEGGSPPIRDEE